MAHDIDPSRNINVDKVPVEDMPPYPIAKRDVVVPPPEHRDDKHDKKSVWRNRYVQVGTAAVGVAAAVAAVVAATGNSSGNTHHAAPRHETSSSAPAHPSHSAETTPATSHTSTAPEQGTSSTTGKDKYGREIITAASLKEIPRDATPEQIVTEWMQNCNAMMASADESFYQEYRNYVVSNDLPIGIDGIISPEIKAWKTNRTLVSDNGQVLDPPTLSSDKLGTVHVGRDINDNPAIELDGFSFYLNDPLDGSRVMDNNGVSTVFAYVTKQVALPDGSEKEIKTWVVVNESTIQSQ